MKVNKDKYKLSIGVVKFGDIDLSQEKVVYMDEYIIGSCSIIATEPLQIELNVKHEFEVENFNFFYIVPRDYSMQDGKIVSISSFKIIVPDSLYDPLPISSDYLIGNKID